MSVSNARALLLALALSGAMLFLAARTVAVDGSGTTRGELMRADQSLPNRQESPAQDGGAVGGQAVIGTDERVRITETTAYPWRAIAYLELYDSFGDPIGTCTGTFVGPDAILTAGHCLRNSGEWVYDIAVVPGKDGASEPFGYEFAESWWVPDEWFFTEDEDWDWGIIAMSSTSLGETVGWLPVAVATTTTLNEPDFTPAIVGYPGDKPGGTLWGAFKPNFVAVQPFTLFHDIDTFGGQSGSAVFSANVDKPYLGFIVGIHVRGGPSANEASRIDGELLDDLLLGCSEMGCVLSYVVETPGTPTPTPTKTPTKTPSPTATKSPTPAGGKAPVHTADLVKGFNLIGGPLLNDLPPSDFVACLPAGSWLSIYIWDASSQRWSHYFPDGTVPAYVNSPQVGGIVTIKRLAGVVLITAAAVPDARLKDGPGAC